METKEGKEAPSSVKESIIASMPVSTSTTIPNMRFVRLNPRFDRRETLELLKSDIRSTHSDDRYPIPVPWLLSERHHLEFFAIPGDFSLNKASSFQLGRVYGMDVTSGAAVAALLFDVFDQDQDGYRGRNDDQTKPKDEPLRVLDLCCAPGLKLCMISDLVPTQSLVVGVDASKSRLSLCKNIVQKYHIDPTTSGANLPPDNNGDKPDEDPSQQIRSKHSSRTTIRLFCADGTTFGLQSKSNAELMFDSSSAFEEQATRGKRKRMNKSARAREKRRLFELSDQESRINVSNAGEAGADDGKEPSNNKYKVASDLADGASGISITQHFDRVLVDAECSSDGAIRHIQKRQSSTTTRGPAWDESNMNELVALQKSLIDSGFRQLKRGGVMVYSTCSLSERQNEEVVQWLLKQYNDAFVIPVSFSHNNESRTWAAAELQFIQEGKITGTVRFNPFVGSDESTSAKYNCTLSGGGFFLAKMGKRHL